MSQTLLQITTLATTTYELFRKKGVLRRKRFKAKVTFKVSTKPQGFSFQDKIFIAKTNFSFSLEINKTNV